MHARFLLGPAGSGKTFRCLAEIRAELLRSPDGAPLLLLAPKQATFQLERQLLTDPSLQGFTRLHILSFDRLAQFVHEQLRVATPRILSDEGRVMVLRALLMRHEAELQLFGRSARRPGFASQLSQLLGELQQHRFTPGKLRALSQNAELPGELRGKLHDLALLMDACKHWFAGQNLQDGDSLLESAAELLRTKPAVGVQSLNIQALWLDGFAEMTPAELDLLTALIPHCEQAMLAFCLEGELPGNISWLSHWSSVARTFRDCHARLSAIDGCNVTVEPLKRDANHSRFKRSAVFRHLELNWSQPTPDECDVPALEFSLSLIRCSTPDAEANAAAREILRFVREGGRFREAAVLVRNLASHHKPLERVFDRFGIPFFLDRRESVAHHPLAELTRSALRTVAFDWRHDDLFAALKAGFSPVDETQIDQLENEALARGWRGAKWQKPFQIADKPELQARLERLREQLVPPFQELARSLESRAVHTGAELADALRNLWHQLRVNQTLEHWTSSALENPAHGERQTAIHATVWQQMNDWLDNVQFAFAAEALPLRDWLPILDSGLANLTIGVIPPALDQVLVGAIDRSRNPELKLALVLGLNEGVFPAAPEAPTIFTDEDRKELHARGEAIGSQLYDRLSRERFFGYIALTRSSRRVVATYAERSADGSTLNPSAFITRLRQLFPKMEETKTENAPTWQDAQHAGELVEPILAIQKLCSAAVPAASSGGVSPPESTRGDTPPQLGSEDACTTSAPSPTPASNRWPELLRLPALASLAENLKRLRNPDPNEAVASDRVEKLFGKLLLTSVSQLEHFAACPFRFFIHAGLRGEERRLFEADSRELGSFQHEVLRDFHEELASDNKRWRDITPQEARERVGNIAARLASEFREGLFQDSEQARFTARVLGEALQDFIETIVRWMREAYHFDPAAVELGFGIDKNNPPTWTLDLGKGHGLALRGRIDRVDTCAVSENEALAVVIDYKSGNKRLDPVLIEHGVQLQLITYLNVLRHWANPPEALKAARLLPAGVFYVNLRGQHQGSGKRTDVLADNARRTAYQHTGRFDAGYLEKFGPKQHGGESDQFNYRVNKDGTLRKGSAEALPHEEFIALLDRTEDRLRVMGREIFDGVAKVDPYRKGTATACDFCDCREICRIDPWTHQFRILKKPEGKNVE